MSSDKILDELKELQKEVDRLKSFDIPGPGSLIGLLPDDLIALLISLGYFFDLLIGDGSTSGSYLLLETGDYLLPE